METYILTNKNDEYWTGKKFIKNEIVDEENSNYFFQGFESPEEAMIFNLMFQNYEMFNIWKCEIKENFDKNWIISRNKSVVPVDICEVDSLTDLQYIGMALIGVLGVIQNNKVRGYCFNFLRNKNRSPECAEKLLEKLINKNQNTKEIDEYVGPVWSLLEAIIKNDYKKHASISLYKSICDSNCVNQPLKFSVIYNAVKNLSLEDIAERISGKLNFL